MRRAAAAGFVVASLLLGGTAPLRADVVVAISKSDQRLAVTVDGKELYRWSVSTGRRGLETPSGKFRPVRFERDWYSRKYDMSPMPHSIFFYKGYAVHGSFETRRLGRPASHGCVRLEPSNASILFNLVLKEGRKDARIVVMNGPLPAFVPAAPSPVPKPAPRIVPNSGVVMSDPTAVAASFAMVEPAVPMPLRRPVVAAAPGDAQGNEHVISVGDDATVLRGRQAWLRSLDRKYGIR